MAFYPQNFLGFPQFPTINMASFLVIPRKIFKFSTINTITINNTVLINKKIKDVIRDLLKNTRQYKRIGVV